MSKIQTEKEKEEKAEPPPRRGWVSLISLYMGLFLFSIILCAGLLVTVLQDRTLTLPKTIQTKLNVFLNTEPDFPEISFSSAEIGFSAILNPKLVLEGVQFSDDLTGSGVRLGKLEVVFDGSKFITGVVAPKSTRLNGAVLDVTRKIDGSFDLGFDVLSGITTTLSVDEVFKKIEGLGRLMVGGSGQSGTTVALHCELIWHYLVAEMSQPLLGLAMNFQPMELAS